MTNDARADASGSISIVRDFDAPRELVFRDWIDPEEVATWFAPDGFTVTLCEVDGRRAGSWRVVYESESGERYLEYGVFHEVRPPEELVFTLKQESGDGRIGPTTLATVQIRRHRRQDANELRPDWLYVDCGARRPRRGLERMLPQTRAAPGEAVMIPRHSHRKVWLALAWRGSPGPAASVRRRRALARHCTGGLQPRVGAGDRCGRGRPSGQRNFRLDPPHAFPGGGRRASEPVIATRQRS